MLISTLLLIIIYLIHQIFPSDPCSSNPEIICVSNSGLPNHYSSLLNAINQITPGSLIRYIYIQKNINILNDEPDDEFLITFQTHANGEIGRPIVIMPDPNVSRCESEIIEIRTGGAGYRTFFFYDVKYWKLTGGVQNEGGKNRLVLRIDDGNWNTVIEIRDGIGNEVENITIIIEEEYNHCIFDLSLKVIEGSGGEGNRTRIMNVDVIGKGSKVGKDYGVRGVRYYTSGVVDYNQIIFEMENVKFMGNCWKGFRCSNWGDCGGVRIKGCDFSDCSYAVHHSGERKAMFIFEDSKMIGDGDYFLFLEIDSFLSNYTYIRNNEIEGIKKGIEIKFREAYFISTVERFLVIENNKFKDISDFAIKYTPGIDGTIIDNLKPIIRGNYFESITGGAIWLSMIGVNGIIENNVFVKGNFKKAFITTGIAMEPYYPHNLTIQNNAFISNGLLKDERIIQVENSNNEPNYALGSCYITSNIFSGFSQSSIIYVQSDNSLLCFQEECEFTNNFFDYEYNDYLINKKSNLMEVSGNMIVTSGFPFWKKGEKPSPYYIPLTNYYNSPQRSFSPSIDLDGNLRGIKTVSSSGDDNSWISIGPFEVPCFSNYAGEFCSECKEGKTCCKYKWDGPNCDICPSNFNPSRNCRKCSGEFSGDHCEYCPDNYDLSMGTCVGCKNYWEGDNCQSCPPNFIESNDCLGCNIAYYGENCEITSCFGYFNDDPNNSTKGCNSRGQCFEFNRCTCDKPALYTGDACERETFFFKMGEFWYLTVITCIIIFCILIGVLAIMFFIVYKLSKKVRGYFKDIDKFKKLKNIDLLLDEQKMVESGDIPNIKVNKKLFAVDITDVNLIQEIGKGGSDSVVYRANWKGKVVAIKLYKTTNITEQTTFDEFEREVNLIASVAHPHIINFYGATIQFPRIGIIVEYCEHGDLNQYFDINKNVSFDEKVRMLEQICAGMEYLHERSIIHRDLKTQNVLLNGELTIKLIDFGLAKVVEEINAVQTRRYLILFIHRIRVGTSFFIAPEVVLSNKYGFKCDVFSFGMVMFCVLENNFDPFKGETSSVDVRMTMDKNYRPRMLDPKKHPNWITKIMKRSWDHEPTVRHSFTKIRKIFLTYQGKIKVSDDYDDDDDDDYGKGQNLSKPLNKMRKKTTSFAGFISGSDTKSEMIANALDKAERVLQGRKPLLRKKAPSIPKRRREISRKLIDIKIILKELGLFKFYNKFLKEEVDVITLYQFEKDDIDLFLPEASNIQKKKIWGYIQKNKN